MISLENLMCPSCGAALAVPPPGATSIRCGYCGHEAMIHAAPPAPPPYVPPPLPVVPYSMPTYGEPAPEPALPPAGASRGGAIVLTVVIVAAIGAAIAALVMRDHGNGGFQWRTRAPIPVTLGGADGFVGVYASRTENDYPLYVAAFDGAKLERVWKAGPYGTTISDLEVTLAGTSIVVTDGQPSAHVLDLATGKETGKVALSDKVKRTCVPTEARGTVWIQTTDEKAVSLDLGTGVARAAPRPASCGEAPPSECEHVHGALAGCRAGSSAPKFDGIRPELVLAEGSDAVVVGERTPGTSTPMAIGFDPRDPKARWQKMLVGDPPASFDASLHAVDLQGGKLIAEYLKKGSKNAGFLRAIDVKTGATLWDVPVPNTDDVAEADEMRITSTRVYLPHWTWLEVFDVKTGAHLGTLGAW